MALEMQKMCMSLTAPDGSPVVMRIGLHFGPLVAGVVGGNMLRYHLFGPAMDAVTQLEQACRHGGVRLSEMFAIILRPTDPRWHGADDKHVDVPFENVAGASLNDTSAASYNARVSLSSDRHLSESASAHMSLVGTFSASEMPVVRRLGRRHLQVIYNNVLSYE